MRLRPRSCLLTAIVATSCLSQVASADTSTDALSMVQLRYFMHQEAQDARVIPSLEKHARKGNLEATHLLAQHLSLSKEIKELRQAAELYEQVFDGGEGNPRVLVDIANLTNRYATLRPEGREDLRRLLPQLRLTADFASVESRLEVFLVYPEIVTTGEVERLIGYYQQACVENCRSRTYQGRLQQSKGNPEEALTQYELAASNDPLAVNLYFDLLGAEGTSRFTAFADAKKDEATQWTTESLSAMGAKLSSLGDSDPTLAMFWLDEAIKKDSLSARVVKANLMMSFPDLFGAEETLELIGSVAQQSPADGRRLLGSAYLVRSWRILNPHKAHDILQQAIAEGDQEAYMGLGELYSMGGLDEADQVKALEAYRQLTQTGHGPAFYRVATLYEGGRSLCHDPLKAYANAQLALDLGQLNAQALVERVSEKLDPESLARAQQLTAEMRRELGLLL